MSYESLEDISNLDRREVGRSDFWFLIGLSCQKKKPQSLPGMKSHCGFIIL